MRLNQALSTDNAPMALRPTIMSLLLVLATPAPAAVDAGAAERLARKSKCMKCHHVEKKRDGDGPPYREIAAKWRGKPDARSRITQHITLPKKIKIEGQEDDHGVIASTVPGEVDNVVDWILSL